MTNDNQDALRCAEYLQDRNRLDLTCDESAAHIRRLVAQNEAKDALLRHAANVIGNSLMQSDRMHSMTVEQLEECRAAIRQHLDQKTT